MMKNFIIVFFLFSWVPAHSQSSFYHHGETNRIEWMLANQVNDKIIYKPIRPLPHHSLAVTHRSVKFVYKDNETLLAPLDFHAPLLGIRYDGPNERKTDITMQLAYGRYNTNLEGSKTDVSMLTASLLTRKKIFTIEISRRFPIGLMVPILFDYRRLKNHNEGDEALDILLMGIGIGGHSAIRLNTQIMLEAKATPILGWSLPSLGTDAGFYGPPISSMSTLDLKVHFEKLFSNRLGLTLAYSIQLERLQLFTPDFIMNSDSEWFKFSKNEQGIVIGFNW